ncbi:MAG: efflux RND transporter permease subunit [Flavobacteriales bacterium]|nr:efflux RND transporter permease subunit [Flavobacteriales bacterium]
MLNKLIKYFIENKIITVFLLLSIIFTGISTLPFSIDKGIFPDYSVNADVLPDIGENQQVIITRWKGRSPQDVEDQISYPLTSYLLGIPGVKTIRSNSLFGLSTIYVIYNEDMEFYSSRIRILEKLNSISPGDLPNGVQPILGPDATALGQVYWYTLEGKNDKGNTTGGWGLEDLRTAQDYHIKHALMSVEGVAEVASIGGYKKEYQIDVNPLLLERFGISLLQVASAVRNGGKDIGVSTLEINRVEYFVRGLGGVKGITDIENLIVSTKNGVSIKIKDLAQVVIGPGVRRGALDKNGVPSVGGVVVVQYGANPAQVIKNVKKRIKEISIGLPSKHLSDGTLSKVHIVPFYDRSLLVEETINTLTQTLWLEILITLIVILVMLANVRAALVVASVLPLSVLLSFVVMRFLNIEANIIALAGIAIAIGTMVDMAIVFAENIVARLENSNQDDNKLELIYAGTIEVASAVKISVATTLISFLPLLALEGPEAKLFTPLIITKTASILGAFLISIVAIPTILHTLFSLCLTRRIVLNVLNFIIIGLGVVTLFYDIWYGLFVVSVGLVGFIGVIKNSYVSFDKKNYKVWMYVVLLTLLLAKTWMPLGEHSFFVSNSLFVFILIGGSLKCFNWFLNVYPVLLDWSLENKWKFLTLPIGCLAFGTSILFNTSQEFMPSLNEGSFLHMPTTMPHSGMEENLHMLHKLDVAVSRIPEVDQVIGKLGRVESALDPAPINMFENVINYKKEYGLNEKGETVRRWRDHIHNRDDIWQEISDATRFLGLTVAPKLQPMETRQIMLSSGLRAPMGIKITGKNLAAIEKMGVELERVLKHVEGIDVSSVFAEQSIGKPYLELEYLRGSMANIGVSVKDVNDCLELALGGVSLLESIEGRERLPVRIKYPKDFLDSEESLNNILIPTNSGKQVKLKELVNISYVKGQQSIKSENGFQVGYVMFDKIQGFGDVEVVENAKLIIEAQIEEGVISIPSGISYSFVGTYNDIVRSNKRLGILIPFTLLVILLIIYLEFKSITTALIIFSSVFVSFSGAFILMWLYGHSGFLNIDLLGINLYEIFQMNSVSLSVAVWVGFIALFGISTDDGVLVVSYLRNSFEGRPATIKDIRLAVLEAGKKRIRPALMTTATTILALIPVLTSNGSGADVLLPMAIPSIGGMMLAVITMFTIPVLYSMWQENKISNANHE